MLAGALVAVGVWWTSNTIAHHFIHRPFFRTRAANHAFALSLSMVLGIPQALWRDRHLAHHAGREPRVQWTPELTIQIAGLTDRGTRTVERRLDAESIILFHLADDGRIVAASGVGLNGSIGRAVRLGQMMIERRLYPDPRLLADPAVNLKTLMREQAA